MKFLIDPEPKAKELIALMTEDEAVIIHNALEEYCVNNKRKVKAKKLKKEFDNKLEVY